MFTQKEHWRHFADFCKWELASGGPDPQLAMIHHVAQRKKPHWAHQCWVGGCYISVYNVPYAEAILRHWPVERALKQKPHEMFNFLKAEWESITTRVERRCVRRQDWMSEFFAGYTKFMLEDYRSLKEHCAKLGREQAYIEAWEVVNRVPRLGRYVALKLLEYLRRYDGLQIEAPDIRPKGGWSPRRTLSVLWERPRIDRKDNSLELLKEINDVVCQTQNRLWDEFNVRLDLFQLQVLLCEYRECYEGERQYPGRSLDSELKYAYKAQEDWKHKSKIWEARAALFPHKHLGELNGWTGPREGPASALANFGYMWSDLLYIYKGTLDYSRYKGTLDYSRPIPWKGMPVTYPHRVSVKTPRKVTNYSPMTKGGIGLAAIAPRGPASTRRPPRGPHAKDPYGPPNEHQPRIYTILEGQLYQSGRWVGFSDAACRAVVERYGLTGIVNLWKPDERLHGLTKWYSWWPLQDGKHVPDQVHIIADVVAQVVRGGGRVLTMCYGGRNRSGLISALVVKKILGVSGEEAYALVKKARKGALVNPRFADYVRTEEGLGDFL